MICGKCKEEHDSVAEVRQCYGALPDAPVDYDEYSTETEQEASIEARGENFFLTNVEQNLYDFHQQEETWEETMERQQREVHEDRMRELRGDHPGHPVAPTPGKRIYLNCPYAEKDDAKRLGAKWDSAKRQWWVDEPTFKAREALFNRWVDGPYVKGPVAPRAGTMTPPVILEDGMYKTPDGTIYKVIHAVNGSGNQYAKRLEVDYGEADEDGNKTSKGSFAYAQGAISKLRPEMMMTLEEAQKYGKLYGFCVVCGRTLTDEGSIAAGIGPICAGKF